MRRFFVFILAILYLAGGGLMLNQHYCMGRFVDAGVGLGTEADDHECSRCGMEKKKNNGCCERKVKILKAYDDQVNSRVHAFKFIGFEAIQTPVYYYISAETIVLPGRHDIQRLQLPPPKKVPVYLINCNWRI